MLVEKRSWQLIGRCCSPVSCKLQPFNHLIRRCSLLQCFPALGPGVVKWCGVELGAVVESPETQALTAALLLTCDQ